MSPDEELMARVKKLVSPVFDQLKLNISKTFWVALTANETGAFLIHNLTVPSRFEPGVYEKLSEVEDGLRLHYGKINKSLLELWLEAEELKALASSWGLTQVMGYNAKLVGANVADLNDPLKHYLIAERVMAGFIRQYGLNPEEDFEKMARCWNTGMPDGQTYDANYVANLRTRMLVWESLT